MKVDGHLTQIAKVAVEIHKSRPSFFDLTEFVLENENHKPCSNLELPNGVHFCDYWTFLWSFTWLKSCNLTVLNDFIFDQTNRLRSFKGRSGHKNQTFGRFCVFQMTWSLYKSLFHFTACCNKLIASRSWSQLEIPI